MNEDEPHKMRKEDSRDPFLSSPEMSSDGGDEMLGFSDVLAEWAKQTRRHNMRETPPIVSHFFDTDQMDHETTAHTETMYRPCADDDRDDAQSSDVRVIHIGRNDDKPSETQHIEHHGGSNM